jgi:hypothetical protein
MKMMTEKDFKDTLRHATTELINHGYELERDPPMHSVEFRKLVITGVYCLIRFQLIHIPDISIFQVVLIRRRLENFSIEDHLYKPLYLDLVNLITGLYKKEIFPPEQYAWDFTDEASLLAQITTAQALIIEYGLKWLEDPASNIDWVRKPRD